MIIVNNNFAQALSVFTEEGGCPLSETETMRAWRQVCGKALKLVVLDDSKATA
jgi:hypothetical protein